MEVEGDNEECIKCIGHKKKIKSLQDKVYRLKKKTQAVEDEHVSVPIISMELKYLEFLEMEIL